MDLITLTGKDGNKVLINADRIDGVIDYNDGIRLVYIGGCLTPFNVKESMVEIESICERSVALDSASVVAELNRKLKVVSKALTEIMEHDNYSRDHLEAANIAEEALR